MTFKASQNMPHTYLAYANIGIVSLIMSMVLVVADWAGDWVGHFAAVESLKIFHGCDSINYLRYGTLDLGSLRRLAVS